MLRVVLRDGEEDMSQSSGKKTTNRRHRLDVGIDAPRGEKMCMKMNQITGAEKIEILITREHNSERVQKVVYCRR